MNDGDLLLRRILEVPEDDAARLVYADWLEENGDPDKAEYIRLEVELEASIISKTKLSPDRKHHVLSRTTVLHRRIANRSRYQLPKKAALQWNRGFIDSLLLPIDYFWNRQRLMALFRRHPITEVTLFGCKPSRTELTDSAGTVVEWHWWEGCHRSQYASLPKQLLINLPAKYRSCLDASSGPIEHVGYKSEREAKAALNVACVKYGRKLVGLDELNEHKHLPKQKD